MELLIIAVISYLIGSIPTAYILLKKRRGIDIREKGSGNVGTLNSYEVTNSKKIGFAVLTIDLLKGLAAVAIAKYFFADTFIFSIIALIFAVLGHCYSVWLKFKGGRGLATTAGGGFIISPLILIIWGLIWFSTYKLKKNIHLANIIATGSVIVLAVLLNTPLNSLSWPPSESGFIFGFSVSLLMLIILSKHWIPLKELIKKN